MKKPSAEYTFIDILTGGIFVEEKIQGNHRLELTNRGDMRLTGVKDVVSFDAGEVLLETVRGMLLIRGDGLHVSRLTLDKGEVDVEGKVDSMAYSEKENTIKTAESVFARLFR